MKKTFVTHFLALIIFVLTQSSVVDTVTTFSPSMQKNIKAVVITPDCYAAGKAFPVIYLLHGFSDNYKSWVAKSKNITQLSDQYNVIYVCPDGATSWYFDSPVNSKIRYETYVSSELVKWVDQHYKTIKNRSGRGITGLSMGGHGALYLAFRHQNVYGVAGSMSGGVDIRPFPNNWDLSKNLGEYKDQPQNWDKNAVINQVHYLKPNKLSIIIDCGTEDFFFQVNQDLHAKLLKMNIPHNYSTRPGAHNWDFWTVSIQTHTLFMNRYFTKKQR